MKYYKFRNASSSFDYDVVEKLNKIVKYQEHSKTNLICGIFSAVMSNSIVSSMNNKNYLNVKFILLLLIIYVLLVLCLRLREILFAYVLAYINKDSISEKQEREKKKVFFDKVVNEAITGISLVNRIDTLQKKQAKQEFWYIYAVQALCCFQRTCEYLDDLVFRGTKKYREKIYKCIGEKSIIWVLETMSEYLDKISDLYSEIDVKAAKEYCKKRLRNFE